MQKSFIIYDDSLDVLDELSDEQAGQLFKAIRNYRKEKPTGLSGLLNAIFLPFKNQLIRDVNKYNNICESRRLAGIKSGESRKKKSKRTKRTSVNFVEQTRTKRTYNDNDNDNDIKEKKIKKEKKNTLCEIEKKFEEFWKKYPNTENQSKKKTKEKYLSLIRNEGTHLEIVRGLDKQIEIY